MALSSSGADEDEHPSTRALIARAVEQTTVIVRQEIALAKAEFTQKARRAVFGLVSAVAAGVTAFAMLLCAVAAGVAGLAGVMPVWAAALLAAGVLGCGAGACALVALRAFAMASPGAPPDVAASVRADVTEIKEQLHR